MPSAISRLRFQASRAKTCISAISIKATTNEKMGFIGREEGVAAYAIALIISV